MRRLLPALLLFFLGWQANAQILHPVKWSFETKEVSPNVYDLYFKASIEKGWHMYSQKNNPDEGPVPTTFTFGKNAGIQLQGDVKEISKVIEVHDPNFDMQVKYFTNQASFVQRAKVTSHVKEINGTLNFMVCDDEKCLPPEDVDFSFKIPKASSDAVPAQDNKKPQTTPADDHKGSSLFTPAPGTENTASAQPGIIHPVKWKYEAKSLGNNQYELRFTASLDNNYHIYGLEKVANGPIPTVISINQNPDIKILGNVTPETTVKKEHDPVFDLDITKYTGQAVFTQKVELLKPVKEISGKASWQACDDKQCLAPEEANFGIPVAGTEAAPASKKETLQAKDSFFSLFGTGFGWGLVTLITPCVFPMIPLTVSFFTKNSKDRGIYEALIFGLSIVVIYVGLGIIVSLVFGSDALNGLASNVYMNMAFFVIFLVFAFSFFGAFDLSLPSSWTNKADAKSEKGGLIGIFFMAFTLALVSFSCTGPFIGNLLVLVGTGNGLIGPIIGMAGFAVAFALPFVIFAMFPSLMQKLPKSGGWLNAVKVVFGFLELAFALKFLSSVDLAYHWGILRREYFLALWIVISILLGFYLLGKLKFSHDTPLNYISVPRLLLAIVSFAFAAYMVPGLWGAPVKLLSGLAPPTQYNEGFLPLPSGEGSSLPTANDAGPAKKYAEIFKSPHGLNAYFDYQQALQEAQKEGKPLMIDFTGWSCANCRKMEENVWVDPNVMKRLRNNFVLVSLYVDDKTELPDTDKFYSKILDKKITTLGGKWGDLEASRYGTNAQPYYVLLDHKEKTLTDPWGGYDPDIQHFIDFLDKGKTEFDKRQQSGAEQVAQE